MEARITWSGTVPPDCVNLPVVDELRQVSAPPVRPQPRHHDGKN
jgi:hypothetical protein